MQGVIYPSPRGDGECIAPSWSQGRHTGALYNGESGALILECRRSAPLLCAADAQIFSFTSKRLASKRVIAAGEAIADAGPRFWNHGEREIRVTDERGGSFAPSASQASSEKPRQL